MVWITKPPLGTQLDWTHPLNNGLVGCWIFNENSGDKVYDLSGNANTGTLTNMSFPSTTISGWNPGRDEQPTLIFDGIDDSINLGSPSNLDIPYPITIEFWINPTDITQDRKKIVEFPYTFVNKFTVRMIGGTAVAFSNVNNGYTLGTSNVLTANSWNHIIIVLTADINISIVYINGISNSLIPHAGIPINSNIFRIAADGYGNNFSGGIDGVRIWNRALTSTEASTLYLNPYIMFIDTKCTPLECSLSII